MGQYNFSGRLLSQLNGDSIKDWHIGDIMTIDVGGTNLMNMPNCSEVTERNPIYGYGRDALYNAKLTSLDFIKVDKGLAMALNSCYYARTWDQLSQLGLIYGTPIDVGDVHGLLRSPSKQEYIYNEF